MTSRNPKPRPTLPPTHASHRAIRVVPPRSHWIVLTILMVLLAGMLLLGGIINHQVGAEGSGGPHTPLGAAGVPSSISGGGPVIDTRAGAQRSYQVQPGKVALTFDDGPDPRWTPQILAVLARHHVPGTFFVIGAHVAENSGIAKAEVRAGDEIGIHTFTHDDLATAPAWRRNLEFSQTQSAIAGATGISTPLLRPPYSSEPDALDRLDWAAIQDSGRQGYLTVLTDRDSEDWRRDGVPAILARQPPQRPRNRRPGPMPHLPGFVLMMHDGGGDRSETVAALDQLIPELQARGYTFTTVTDAVGAPSPLAPAKSTAVWQGRILIAAINTSGTIVSWLGWAVFISGFIGGARILLLIIMAKASSRPSRATPAATRFPRGPQPRPPVKPLPAADSEPRIGCGFSRRRVR